MNQYWKSEIMTTKDSTAFPYMIMLPLEEVANTLTNLSKTTPHITLKRRFRLLDATEQHLLDTFTKIPWKPIQIITKGVEKFSKSGVEYIAIANNEPINSLFIHANKLLEALIETRDPHKEIGYDKEHANAHISVHQLAINISEALVLYGDKQLMLHRLLLVKDSGGDYLEVVARL